MLPDELESHDKHQSAVHEVGHAIVALTKGIILRAWLERSGTNNALEDKTWIGHVQNVYGGFGATGDPVIGVAGIVAECFADEPGIDTEQIMEQWKMNGLTPSESDLELINTTNWHDRSKAVDEALKILSKQKVLFQVATQTLVDFGELSADRLIVLSSQYLIK